MAATGPVTAADIQLEEVESLKSQFGKSCRVIKDVGDFSHVVDIKLPCGQISLKFQLSASYPNVPPEVIVRAPRLEPSLVSELSDHLVQRANTLVENPMIVHLVELANTWLADKDVHTGGNDDAQAVPNTKDKGKIRKLKKNKGKEKEEKAHGKLPSMKTADDVIKRIMWDDQLIAEDFSVGYLDRFLGVMEKTFTAFSWEDVASADYSVLAIPKHRIQYFKYKDEIVWDKNDRLDNVFGSTGGGKTIMDVIDQYEETSVLVDRSQTVQTDNPFSDDSEDDVEINLTEAKQGTAGHEVGSDYWENKLRPNYFVCLRITDQDILEAVEAMQDAMLDQEERYTECIIKPAALHITLCTLGLDTPELIANACSALKEAKSELTDLARKKITIKIQGVDNFYNRVIYAKVHHNQDLMDFAQHLRILMKERGVEIRDNHEFNPHMTIMKTTRPVSRAMKTKEVATAVYQEFSDMYFGEQVLDKIHLCPMNDQRDTDGFYLTPATINFL